MYDVIERMAVLTKQSRSKVISGMLEPCYMPMMRTVAILEAAQDAPDDLKHGLVNTMQDMESEITALLGITERETTRLYDNAEKQLELDGVDPLRTNRGVRKNKPLKNKKKKKMRKGGKK